MISNWRKPGNQSQKEEGQSFIEILGGKVQFLKVQDLN